MSAQPMIRFIAANGLVVCSISTIVKRLESTRSNSCTKRVFPPADRAVVGQHCRKCVEGTEGTAPDASGEPLDYEFFSMRFTSASLSGR